MPEGLGERQSDGLQLSDKRQMRRVCLNIAKHRETIAVTMYKCPNPDHNP